MRITDAYTKWVDQGSAATTRKVEDGKGNEKAGVTSNAGPGAAVKVSVSNEARALADRADAGIDGAKVTRLKSEIEGGTYQIDAPVIAARLVDGGASG